MASRRYGAGRGRLADGGRGDVAAPGHPAPPSGRPGQHADASAGAGTAAGRQAAAGRLRAAEPGRAAGREARPGLRSGPRRRGKCSPRRAAPTSCWGTADGPKAAPGHHLPGTAPAARCLSWRCLSWRCLSWRCMSWLGRPPTAAPLRAEHSCRPPHQTFIRMLPFDRIPVRSNEPTTSLYRAGLTFRRHVEQMFEIAKPSGYPRQQIGINRIGRSSDGQRQYG